jgi:hypothetical protein
MPRTLTDAQLAAKLGELHLSEDVAPFVAEAARRLREFDFRHLTTAAGMVEAIHADPAIPEDASRRAELVIMSVPLNRRGYSTAKALADRILKGQPYTTYDVATLASHVVTLEDMRDDKGDIPSVEV